MRICYVSQEYPPETGRGGIGTYTRYMAEALAGRGHEVHVISESPSRGSDSVRNGVRVHRLPQPRVPAPVHQLLRAVLVRKKVAALGCFHVLEAPDWGGEAVLMPRGSHGKVVTRFHMNIFLDHLAHGNSMGPRARLIDAMEVGQTRVSTGYTSPSNRMAEVLYRRLGLTARAVKVIPNGIPVASYISSLQACHEGPQEEYVFFPGRIGPNKGALVLAGALPSVLDAHPGVCALLTGRSVRTGHGDTKSLMLKRLGRHAARVSFTGFVSPRRYQQMLAGARVVVIPSLWDNFPYACLEAMCAEKAIVATRAGGLPEMVEDGVSGLLVPAGDEAALAKAVNRCLDDERLSRRLGMGALKRVKLFDIATTASATLRFYQS